LSQPDAWADRTKRKDLVEILCREFTAALPPEPVRHIRPLTRADLDDYVALCRKVSNFPSFWNTVRVLCGLYFRMGPIAQFRFIRGFLYQARAFPLPADVRERTLRQDWLLTDPDFQGGGLGARMKRHVITLAERFGFRRLEGYVSPRDPRLEKLYTGVGATVERVHEGSPHSTAEMVWHFEGQRDRS
jgi:GNAT superfamily N-acetyltransferase